MSMKTSKLGNSGLEVGPLALGGNVFGWTADEPTSFRLLDAFVAGGFNLIDTADVYSRWAPGNQGGESETVIGRWFRHSGRRRRHPGHQGWQRDGAEGEGPLQAIHLPCGGAVAETPPDRLHRPLPVAHRRCDHSARRDPRSLGELIRRARSGRSALQTLRPGGSPRRSRQRPEWAARLRVSSAALQPPWPAALFEDELEPLCRQAGLGVISPLLARCRVLDGQVPIGARPGSAPHSATVKKYLRRTGLSHPSGSRSGRRAVPFAPEAKVALSLAGRARPR